MLFKKIKKQRGGEKKKSIKDITKARKGYRMLSCYKHNLLEIDNSKWMRLQAEKTVISDS